MTVSARVSADVSSNPRLRIAVDKALAENMTRDTIDRAIKRGAGATEGENYDELLYEGYGIGGVAVLVETMTDNRNRTVSDVRNAFTKYGGNLGTDGSVAYLFSKQGVLSYDSDTEEDALMEAALEAGADDVQTHEDGSIDVMTSPDTYSDVKDALIAAGFAPGNAEITQVPSTKAELDAEQAKKFFKMLDMLEDLDDVQDVFHNADISDDILASIE